MALPSSPPLLPAMASFPSSPPLPAADTFAIDLDPISIDPIGPRRKRPRSNFESQSSDPLFSEGASDSEGLEEQGQPSRKRLVRGLENIPRRRFEAQGLRRRMARREGLKNADSAVWMGSDASEDSLDAVVASSQRKMESLDVSDETMTDAPLPGPEQVASEIISRCLDTGHESVDLANLDLTHLSDATLYPLHQLIRHPHADLDHPPSEDEFRPLIPAIQLFLAGNRLTSLPPELFTLANTTVLSLRNNELQQLPPSVGHLHKLIELNIAQNQIRWLPWELFDLLTCREVHRKIILRPNPLVQPLEIAGPSPLPRPAATSSEIKEHLSRWGEIRGAFFEKMKEWYREEDAPWTMRHELELRLKLGVKRHNLYLQAASDAGKELRPCSVDEQTIYLASATVQFFDVDGSPLRGANTASDVLDEHPATMDPLAHSPVPDSTAASATPSLFELTLRTAQTHFSLSGPLPDTLPPALDSGLREAAAGAAYGNKICATCGCDYIVTRAEWVEYWFHGSPGQSARGLTQDTVVPFLRRVCSWACARPSEIGTTSF